MCLVRCVSIAAICSVYATLAKRRVWIGRIKCICRVNKQISYTLSREYRVARYRYSRLLFTSEDRLCANLRVRMRCGVFQKYSAHRLVTTLSTHRDAAFWNTRHAVVFPMFQKWSFGASSRDSGRYVDANLKQTAIPQINQMAISFKTFTMPSLREIWVTSSTKRRELRHEDILSAASPVSIHTTHFSTKRRELRHKDFWNRRHAVPRRLFQNVNLECCAANIYPYNPFPHEATGASSRRLLKHMAHSTTPSVSKCACWALRHQYTSKCESWVLRHQYKSKQPISHEATGASSRRVLKQTTHSAAPSVSKCVYGALRRQYTSI